MYRTGNSRNSGPYVNQLPVPDLNIKVIELVSEIIFGCVPVRIYNIGQGHNCGGYA
jgi:hypothetical protein